MQKLPDVLGKPLEEAQSSLKEAGYIPLLKITSPADGKELTGNYRVVRQKLVDENHVELVIALETEGKEVGKDGI